MPVRTAHPWLMPMATLGLMAGILLGRGASTWHMAAAGLAVSLACVLVCRGRYRTVGAVLTALFLGAVLSWAAYHPALPVEGEHIVTGVVVQEVHQEADHVQSVLRDVTVDGHPWHGGAYWTYYTDPEEPLPEELIPGARIAIVAEVYHPSGEENPGGFSFQEYLLQRDVQFGVYGADEMTFVGGGFSLHGTMAHIRHVLTHRLIDVMGEEAGGYAAAMLLGERDYLPDSELEAFSRLGITHILSISGYHVGVLSVMLALMLRPLRLRRSHALLLRGGVLFLYCLLTGGHAPVIRAALLAVLWELGRVRHRQNLALHTLCCAASVQLIFSPALLTSASFQLTYSAMVGLLLLRPGIERLVHTDRPILHRVWTALSACIAAQIGILPAELYWFGSLPVWALLANLLIIPLFTGLLLVYWLTLLLLWLPGVREALGWLSAVATRVLMNGIRPLGEIGGAYLWTRQPDPIVLLGWLLLCLGLTALPPRRYAHRQRVLALTGALLCLTVLLPLPNIETTYIQFSVGEADAALLHDRDAVVVIDTGEDGQALSGYLRRQNLTVDALIITHLHSDHAGGIAGLIGDGVAVRRCYLPADALVPSIDPEVLLYLSMLAQTGTEFRSLSRGDVLDLPSGSLTVLWPEEGRTRPMQDANHSCLVLLAELRGTTMLLTGDLTGTYEHYAAVPADVLKAAHHGSATSTSAAFLAAVDPQVILQSCGNEEREAAFASRAGEIPVVSTHSSGAVTIRFDEGGFRVYPFLTGE